jgi:hypothetical protein
LHWSIDLPFGLAEFLRGSATTLNELILCTELSGDGILARDVEDLARAVASLSTLDFLSLSEGPALLPILRGLRGYRNSSLRKLQILDLRDLGAMNELIGLLRAKDCSITHLMLKEFFDHRVLVPALLGNTSVQMLLLCKGQHVDTEAFATAVNEILASNSVVQELHLEEYLGSWADFSTFCSLLAVNTTLVRLKVYLPWTDGLFLGAASSNRNGHIEPQEVLCMQRIPQQLTALTSLELNVRRRAGEENISIPSTVVTAFCNNQVLTDVQLHGFSQDETHTIQYNALRKLHFHVLCAQPVLIMMDAIFGTTADLPGRLGEVQRSDYAFSLLYECIRARIGDWHPTPNGTERINLKRTVDLVSK